VNDMKKVFLQILLALLLTVPLMAQTERQEPQAFDQFGKINLEELMSRLDNFIIAFRNSPNTKAVIRTYASEENCFLCRYHFGALINAYLKNTRKVDAGQYSIEYCDGEGDDLLTELYLLPPSVTKLAECKETIKVPKKSVLFDTVYFYYKDNKLLPLENSVVEIGPTNGIYTMGVLKQVKNFLDKSSASKIYVIVYLGTNPEQKLEGENDKMVEKTVRNLDKKPLAGKMLRNARKELIKNGVRQSQIQTIEGGYNEDSRRLEFWFVPEGGEIPKLTSDYLPKN
jgi:hypothetical protein